MQTVIVRLVILGVSLFSLQRLLVRPVASLSWPITKGVFISSEVIFTKAVSPGDDFDAWHPHVLYRYSVNEAEYLSDRIETFNTANGNTDRFSQQIVSRYPPGMQVDVYYYPEDPGFSVLEPGFPNNDPILLIMFLMGLIMLGGLALSSVIELLKILMHSIAVAGLQT
jgi:hypothetical protein